jgi:hypothetical protein
MTNLAINLVNSNPGQMATSLHTPVQMATSHHTTVQMATNLPTTVQMATNLPTTVQMAISHHTAVQIATNLPTTVQMATNLPTIGLTQSSMAEAKGLYRRHPWSSLIGRAISSSSSKLKIVLGSRLSNSLFSETGPAPCGRDVLPPMAARATARHCKGGLGSRVEEGRNHRIRDDIQQSL